MGMENFGRDLRYAVRIFSRRPLIAVITVMTLALGIGSATAIFTVVKGVLLEPLPFPEPDRIVTAWEVSEKGSPMRVTGPNFFDWLHLSRSFEALAAYSGWFEAVITGGQAFRAPVTPASRGFFESAGVQPMIGRLFLPEETRSGAPLAAMVSHSFWRDALESTMDFSSISLRLGDQSARVVGVMPQDFHFLQESDIWIPAESIPRFGKETSRTAHNWKVIGRLKRGTSLQAAQAEISAITRQLKAQYGSDMDAIDAQLMLLHDDLVFSSRKGLLLLMGAVGALLLIACANAANVLAAQAAGRQRELSVRLALGAARQRLVSQFMAESTLLCLAAAALGILFSFWGVDLLLALAPANLPRVENIGLDVVVLLFALGLSLGTALLLALSTALHAFSRDFSQALKEGARLAGGGAGHILRRQLVVAQIALTLILLSGAGLFARSFLHLIATDPGFRTEDVMTMDLFSPSPQDEDPASEENLVQFHQELLSRLEALPEVRHVGGVSALPMGGGSNGTFIKVNSSEEVRDLDDFSRLAKDPQRSGYADFRIASEGYFAAMAVPLLRGRLFDSRDHREAPHVALISQTLARRNWPNEDPLGKLIQFGNMDGDLKTFRVIGIVGDVRERLASAPSATFYGYYRQRPSRTYTFTLVLHAPRGPEPLIASVRKIVHDLDPEVPVRFRTLEEIVSSSISDKRFQMILLAAFAAAALVLAAMGIYGIVAHLVTERTAEIGVRVALGARPADVLLLILSEIGRLVGAGIILGLMGALALGQVLASLLFGVTPTDPLTLALMTIVLTATAILAWIIHKFSAAVPESSVLTALRSVGLLDVR